MRITTPNHRSNSNSNNRSKNVVVRRTTRDRSYLRFLFLTILTIVITGRQVSPSSLHVSTPSGSGTGSWSWGYACHAFSATSRVQRQQRGRRSQGGGRTTINPTITTTGSVTTTIQPEQSFLKHKKTTDDQGGNIHATTPSTTTTTFVPTVRLDREQLWKLAGQTSRRRRKKEGGYSSVSSTMLSWVQEKEERVGSVQEEEPDNNNGGTFPLAPTPSSALRLSGNRDHKTQSTEDNVILRSEDIESIRLVQTTTTATTTTSDDETVTSDNFDACNAGKEESQWSILVTLVNGTTLSPMNPQTLHQRRDFAIWMAARGLVNVTASELGAIIGNSFFTTREQLLSKKLGRPIIIPVTTDAPAATTTTDIVEDDNDNNNSPRSVGGTVTASSSPLVVNQRACDWGIRMEPKALKQYMEVTGNKVIETGLHIRQFPTSSNDGGDEDMQLPAKEEEVGRRQRRLLLIGASPDGLVVEEEEDEEVMMISGNPYDDSTTTATTRRRRRMGLLEIKCLWGRRHKKELPQFDHCPKRFYDQIQGQLAVCDLDFCDLMLYIPPTGNGGSGGGSGSRQRRRTPNQSRTKSPKGSATSNKPKNYCIVRVLRDEAYWKNTLLPSVQSFCDDVELLKSSA